MLSEKRILVTGAAGFIGSNLTDELLNQGAEVIGIDNMFNGRVENLVDARKNPKFCFIKGDVRDMNLLLEVMKDVDIIYHQAAFTSVPQSVLMPQLCNDVNVTGMINILNSARIRDIGKIVFASSSSVYGNTPTLPKHEEMKLLPISPYGVSKLAAEKYLLVYNKVYDLNTTALRYFNVFGPRQKDSSYSGVIAIFMSKIFRNENPVIFGDGTQTRDFTYIKDIVRANILTGSSSNTAGKAINIAANSPISLNELTKVMIEAGPNKNLTIKYDSKRKGDILHSYGDTSLAKEILDYEAQYNAVNGFKEYLKYYKNKFFPNS